MSIMLHSCPNASAHCYFRVFRRLKNSSFPALAAPSQRERRISQRRWQSAAAASPSASSPKISNIVDQISQLTLLETADLVSSLKVCTVPAPPFLFSPNEPAFDKDSSYRLALIYQTCRLAASLRLQPRQLRLWLRKQKLRHPFKRKPCLRSRSNHSNRLPNLRSSRKSRTCLD